MNRATPIGSQLRLLALALAVAAVLVAAGFGASDAASRTDAQRLSPLAKSDSGAPLVERGDLLVGDVSGHLRVLDRKGELVRRIPGRIADYGPQGVALAPDRRHAFVSVDLDESSLLYEVDLATGVKRVIANAISPVLSPNGQQLAYVTTELRDDILFKDAVVIRDLSTGLATSTTLGGNSVLGTPPENVINWSPDGRSVAVIDGRTIKLVQVGTMGNPLSQPVAPRRWSAPVFRSNGTLVALANCCVGRHQRLVAIKLRSGKRHPFATLRAPPVDIRRLNEKRLLAVTALEKLTLVSRGKTRGIARRITAATG